MHALTILCPVDYSDCSKRAVRFAGALAEHFAARLVVIHVFDRLVAGAAALHHFDLTGADGQEELRSFVADHLPQPLLASRRLEHVVMLGTPADEILAAVRTYRADLLVMGTHGFSGVRKAMFGSTLRTVLRYADLPVLAVPLVDHRDASLLSPLVADGPVLAPVDFSPESRAAAQAAGGVAAALGVPRVGLHVVPAPSNATCEIAPDPSIAMKTLIADVTAAHPETLILEGDPAEVIARTAREKKSPLIVMSLGSSAAPERKPGSVAYRVLCLAPVPILALPETPAGRLHVAHLHRTEQLRPA